ncbi:MAG: hypothetical protein IKK63_05460 [Clostridia bacterium]|nr:hypothetical protein [Clostridia bacterium]
MQKKIKKSLAAILSLLMIMTAIPFTPVAVATDGADPITEKDCTEHADTDGNEFCDVCGELINAKVITADSDGMVYVDGEALEITGYYNNDLILPAGNYKLTGDVTSAYYISANEGEVTLDLNGYVWDMRDCYLLLSNQFSLYDTSDAGTGKLTSSWRNTVYIGKTDTQCGTFNLYSGTVENTSTVTDSYIINASYGDANLYGGKIKGNAYAFFNYMFSDLTINLDGTVIENGEGYAQVKSDLMDGDTPKTVIDVTDFTGESFTVDAEIDEEGKIKIFEGIKSAQEAENYQINFLTKYGEVYCEKTEYDEATGEKYIYVLKNAFTQQPSDKNNYTVEFNNPDASFQWYEVNENEIGKYTTEEGDHLFPYDFKKGDILKVTTASEIEYAVIEAGSYRLRLDKENKTATVRIDEDETIEIFTRFVDSENDVELNFSVIKEISLEGETGKTLQTPKYGNSYWCKATVGTKVYPSDIAFICYTHDYDENGKCYYCKMQAAAKVTDKDGNKLSDSPCETFAEAVTAASASEGSILTLLDDVNLTSMLEIASGKFILDLNGKTIINPDGIEIGSAAELTIVDSASGGKISGDMFGILNDGSLTVNGGVIKASCAVYNYGTVTVDGGNIQGYITNNGALIVNDGILTRIKNPNTSYTATVEINGGTFTDFNTIENNDGDITVKGGIYPNGFSVTNDGNLEYTANSILAEDYYYKDADGKLIDVADDAKIISGYVKVSKGADLSEAVITVEETEFVYNGQHQAPAVTVTIGGKTLTENVDYALNARKWENGVPVQWFYYVDAGVHTLTINGLGDYTGTVKKEFVIKPAMIDIIWEGDEFYYTGNPHKVTAKYVDVNGDENPAAITQNKTNTEVGKYIATAIVEDANYTANGATINHAYEIKWYDKSPAPEIDGQKGENGWYTNTVYFFGEQGFQVGFQTNSFSHMITMPDSGIIKSLVVYTIEEATGYIAKFELGKFAVDRNDPTAEIVMAENKWNSFFNTVTFGKFFKETQSVTITASDETSGVAKIEYFVSTEEITDFENIEWIEYSEAFTIQPNSKNIIYAKATDNAGRYVIVNSEGIVLYTDSALDTSFKDEVVYVLTKNASQAFNLNLNGNTVAYVKIDETVLDAENYEVLGNMIMVSDEILENLAAGEYVITVGFNPMGEEFVDGDAPAEVTIPLTVKKADVTVEIKDFGKVYDGKPVTADYKISKSSDSSPAASNIDYNETVEFKVKGSDDSTYSTEAPINAGEYTVRITVAETDKINSAEVTADFKISKKNVTATATAPDKVYDGTVNLDLSKVIITLNGVAEGDDVEFTIIGGAYFSPDVNEKVRVVVSYDVSGEDTANYEFREGVSIPEMEYYPVMTFAAITAKDISDGFIILGDALTYNGKEQTQTVEKVLATGTAPEVTYTVSGNKATNVGVYFLTVTGTGNFTGEAKIAYEIAVDTKCVSHIELVYTQINGVYERVWKVKSTDRESLEYVLDQLNNAVTDIAPGNKKERWNEMKADCEEILGIINSIEFFIANVEEDYAGFSEDTVKSSDISALDELAGKINAFKERYVYNLTDEEEKKLEDIFDGIEKLKEKIAETEEKLEEIKGIENNFNPENVSSDDKTAIEDKIAEIEEVNPDNLTDEQKAEYDEIKAGFEALLEEITAAEKAVADIGDELEMFDEKRVTIFWEDDIEALKAKIDELLADENMGEAEKAKLNEYKAQAEKLIEIINTPVKYFSLRFFYFIWDSLHWLSSHVIFIFNWIVAMF